MSSHTIKNGNIWAWAYYTDETHQSCGYSFVFQPTYKFSRKKSHQRSMGKPKRKPNYIHPHKHSHVIIFLCARYISSTRQDTKVLQCFWKTNKTYRWIIRMFYGNSFCHLFFVRHADFSSMLLYHIPRSPPHSNGKNVAKGKFTFSQKLISNIYFTRAPMSRRRLA